MEIEAITPQRKSPLAMTYEDHVAVNSTPSDELKGNIGKTRADLMSPEQIIEYLKNEEQLINTLEKEQDNSFAESALASRKIDWRLTIDYLQKSGKLPKEFMEVLSPKSEPMLLSKLNNSIIDDIVSLYADVTSSDLAKQFVEEAESSRKLEYVQKIFGFSNAVEWRFGSSLSEHTKLYIKKAGWRGNDLCVVFFFDPNFGASDPMEKRKTELIQMGQSFKEKVNQYLEDHHLAIEKNNE
jgi:hypothetical protein